jgi:aminoglycoside phosphotransferase (APT) family kinase protein
VSEPLDPLAVLDALGVRDATAVTPVRGGFDTAIWRVERPGGACALRVFRPEQAPVCLLEAAALQAAGAAGVPVPRVLLSGAWRDRPAVLISWCPGRPLADELKTRPWRAWALGAALGRTQAAIHAVPVPAALQRTTLSWLDRAPTAGAALRARLAGAGTPVLAHLDYHPMNVLAEGGHLTAVIDWVDARAADPRADLARTYSLLRVMPWRQPWPLVLPVSLLRRVLAAGWRHGYRSAAGWFPGSAGLAPYYAWAGAVMERDVGRRLGQPGVPFAPADLEGIRRWTAGWRRRAGVPEAAPAQR